MGMQDFVSAVMDVDYSPTGREFVAGGYDRSVRIFAHNGGHSREVYHTKRMQRVFAVRFSGDASYVFSGSDDMNLRVWKVGPILFWHACRHRGPAGRSDMPVMWLLLRHCCSTCPVCRAVPIRSRDHCSIRQETKRSIS